MPRVGSRLQPRTARYEDTQLPYGGKDGHPVKTTQDSSPAGRYVRGRGTCEETAKVVCESPLGGIADSGRVSRPVRRSLPREYPFSRSSLRKRGVVHSKNIQQQLTKDYKSPNDSFIPKR